MIPVIWSVLTNNPIARAIAKIGGVIFAVLTMRALWKRDGRKEAEANQAVKDAKAFKETTERMQDAEAAMGDDPAVLRDRLRHRNPDQR